MVIILVIDLNLRSLIGSDARKLCPLGYYHTQNPDANGQWQQFLKDGEVANSL